MKKRSLLTFSLVSLVGLVGCNKQASGAAAKCSAAAFDDIVSAQFGLYYVDSYCTAEFPEYQYAEVTFSYSVKFTGYFADVYGENISAKGKFIAIQDLSSYSWSVDPEQEYSEEELALFEEYIGDAPLGVVSWANAAYYDTKLGAYLEELCEANEGYSVSFTTKPSFTLTAKSAGEDQEEIPSEDEEADPEYGDITYTIEQSQAQAYADKYGFCTYSLETYDWKQKGVEVKALNGAISERSEYSVRYFNVEEPEEDLGD